MRALWPGLLAILALALAWRAPLLAGAQAAPYRGPLVDTHLHLEAESGVDINTVIALYDAVGVRGGWAMGVPWQRATDAWERYPTRIVPFLAEGYTATLHPDATYRNPAGLEELLAGGYVRGLGEVILRHSAFRLAGGYSAPATHVPADHPALLTAYAIAGRYGAPVVVHQEAAYADELERAVQAAPGTAFVWAHAGHGPAAVVRRLLARNPNLYADLSARTPWLGPGTVLMPPGGPLQAEWAALLHEYPDRFLIGLDLFAPFHFRLAYVRDTVEYYRALLGRLDPAVAEQIAYRNAERLAPFVEPAAP
jgi:Tat protein secretion system quality control protein TatD with DNase activity